ncbi:hypothetical protein Pcinc_008842 [Petrolisthes cinctipes]|uniref:Uncharacterized protein n=1 Tax=Petrolisthes cinctipes TaxID=88211 RepID=A0AAE1KX56_PETCI|nr:hypothetical protein Pcinc_008842 [Petrolisthes cinctipes]
MTKEGMKAFTQEWTKQIEAEECIETQWKLFRDKLKEAEEKHIPSKYINYFDLRKSKLNNLNKETREAIRKKHRCWQRYMETRDQEKFREHTKQRNKVKKLTRKIDKDNESSIAKEAKSNAKKFWKHVKSKLKTATTILDLVEEIDGEERIAISNK